MRWLSGTKRASSGSSLASLLSLLLLSTQCVAQLSNLPGLSDLSTASLGGGASSTATSDETSSTGSAATTGSATATSGRTQATTTSATTSNTESASVSLLRQTTTSTTADSASETTGGIFHLSNLPTIAGASIPSLIVPYTANAPYMQKSSLPEGSVFIIVGAILGFFGACILAWRGLVALSLRRSVKRAALAQQQTFDLKSQAFPTPSAGMYGAGPPGSSASMEKMTPIPRASKRNSHRPSTSQGGLPSALAASRNSTTNLFFSPTAGAGLHSHSPSPALSQRPSSNYLPAGYYAAGSSLPAGGAATTHINGHANNRGSSMLNPLTDRLAGMRAETAGYQRAGSFGPSPPESPAISPSPNHLQRIRTDSPGASSVVGQVGGPTIGGNGLYAQSASSLNLNVPGGTTSGGRTPSAYLEDLFENHGTGPRERF